jgi:hypothetical protein
MSTITHVRTATGSLYSFDKEHMNWSRSSDHEVLGLPAEHGSALLQWPDINIGERILILSTDGTWVSTSGAVETWTEEA